jgi:hypothetical protein
MKRNAMLDKIESRYNALFHAKMDTLMQMGQDAAMIAAHEVLQLGPGRAEAFCAAYIDAMNDMARMVVSDQLDDKEFVYAKHKIDEQIKAIVGEKNFVPWEERYGKQKQ